IIDKKIKHLALEIKSEFISSYQSQNVWGIVEGTKYKDSCFVFIAHYDHLGKVGDVHFPGANDNASGVAVLLDLAKYYAKNPAEHSVVFIFATGEEVGLLGSKFAAENPYIDLEKVKFLFNLDMCGTGATGVAVINGLKEPEAGKLLQEINNENQWFIKVFLGEESCNSDHCHFVQKGVPAHFLFTYGCEYNEYHTIYDNGKDLPFTKHIDFCNLLKEFVRRY
ncbi:MAG: M20/M25/M40 family metallo-hydrolase, partial [Bacteroidales bacterium]|nr:M20/M25/M40 family metallo-hydrolase [Bacteroidales bacterium]